MTLAKKIIFILAGFNLTGCSYFYGDDGLFKDTSYEYLRAEQTEEIVLPDGFSQRNKLDHAQIPQIGEKAKQTQLVRDLSEGAPVQVLAVLDNVREDRLSEIPAVYIQDDVDFVWSGLLDLFNQYEIVPELQDNQNRVIDTGWIAVDQRGIWIGIENAEEIDDFRARFELKILPADIKGELKLQVQRVAAQVMDSDTDQWTQVPTFWQDSVEMLNFTLLAYENRLHVRELEKRQEQKQGFAVTLATDSDNNAALAADLDVESVWDKLPNALKRAGFTVTDKDTGSRIYYLKYQKEEEGFFASLFNEEKPVVPLDEGDYQIALSALGEGSLLSLKDEQGLPLTSSTMSKIFPALSQAFFQKNP